MTNEEAKKILSEYVKACNEGDFTSLEMFKDEKIIEAMAMGAKALSKPSLPSNMDEAAELSANDAMIKRQFPSVVYNTHLKCFNHSDLIKQFKAGAEWGRAAEFLDLAKKELTINHRKHFEERNQVDTTLQDRLSYKEGFDIGKEEGKAEALKDLPRWKKIGRGNNYSTKTKFAINGRYLEMNDTLNDVYEIALSDIEKLPIFKED